MKRHVHLQLLSALEVCLPQQILLLALPSHKPTQGLKLAPNTSTTPQSPFLHSIKAQVVKDEGTCEGCLIMPSPGISSQANWQSHALQISQRWLTCGQLRSMDSWRQMICRHSTYCGPDRKKGRTKQEAPGKGMPNTRVT